jgi:hypothetical protein
MFYLVVSPRFRQNQGAGTRTREGERNRNREEAEVARTKAKPISNEDDLRKLAKRIRAGMNRKMKDRMAKMDVSQRNLGAAIGHTGAALVNGFLKDPREEGAVQSTTLVKGLLMAQRLNIDLGDLVDPDVALEDIGTRVKVKPEEAEILALVRELGVDESRSRLHLMVEKVYRPEVIAGTTASQTRTDAAADSGRVGRKGGG